MARRKKPEISDIFAKGAEFFNSINNTLLIARDLFGVIKDSTKSFTSDNKVSQNNDINDEEKIKKSSYRFMKLKPGCGADSIKNRFREMVKERRPDLKEDTDKTQWFTALQVARETLLKYEK
jgi:hypothetical protein